MRKLRLKEVSSTKLSGVSSTRSDAWVLPLEILILMGTGIWALGILKAPR